MRKELAPWPTGAKVIAAIVVAVVIVAVVVARTMPFFPGRVRAVTVATGESNGNVFTLAPGEFFEIRLNENRTTPYNWSLVKYDHNVVIKVRDFYDSDWAPPGTTGSGGTHVWRFQATGPGTTPIQIVHHRIDQKPGHYQGEEFKVTVGVDNNAD